MRIPLAQPTALTLAENVSRACGREVFVKHDNATHPRYGGNKVRKLEYLLAAARARGATDIITVGAVGSHHVLATAVHGAAAGFRVEAVLVPQPASAHAARNLRADLAQGATLFPAARPWQVPLRVAARVATLRAQGKVPYVIPPGGSTPRGACGYIDAVAELRQQSALLSPGDFDVMVCALGSGGTHAGLLAGSRLHGVRAEVVGVRVTEPWMSTRTAVAWLANRAMALADPTAHHQHPPFAGTHVKLVTDQLGAGYGHPTDAAREAQALFARDDVTLDLTYTAKAAAGLLALCLRDPAPRRYLFWNTLSSAPVDALIPDLDAPLPAALAALLEG